MLSRGSPVQGQSMPVCHRAALEVALACVDLGVNRVIRPYPCSQLLILFYTYSVREGLSLHHISSVPGPMGFLAVTPGHKGSIHK